MAHRCALFCAHPPSKAIANHAQGSASKFHSLAQRINVIADHRSLVSGARFRTHNPLVPGSNPGGPTNAHSVLRFFNQLSRPLFAPSSNLSTFDNKTSETRSTARCESGITCEYVVRVVPRSE